MDAKPQVVVIAGPNGAGKSTIAPDVLQGALQVDEFVNADTIARGLSEFHPDRVSIAAGKMMLERLQELAWERSSFAFETTLATRSFAATISKWKSSGYWFHLVYVWLPTADLAVDRVAARVQRGGHHVPEPTIRRRYDRSLSNLFGLYIPLADRWELLDNSTEGSGGTIAHGGASIPTMVIRSETWRAIEVEHARD